MVFDGRPYAGGLGLVAPIYAHPEAAHVGSGLAQIHRISNQALRNRARTITHMTYQCSSRIGLVPPGFVASTWVDVASCSTYLPSYCSAILARVQGRVAAAGTITVNVRVILTDGSNTDTGTATTATIQPTFPAEGTVSVWMPGDPAVFAVDAAVNAADARVNPGPFEERTITVQAYAVGPSGGGVRLTPGLITVAWVAYG